MCRITKTRLAAQKKSVYATERDLERVQKKREEYVVESSGIDIRRFKFLDEAGSNLAMTRIRGRGAPGERVFDTVPQNYGENVSMLAALSVQGVSAPMTIRGAVDGLVFLAYLKEVLCPTLSEGDVVVMDNLPAHKVKMVRQLIEGCGERG